MSEKSTNLPGYGAEQMASRASKRAERLKAEQNLGDPTDAVLKRLEQAERTRRNYSQGAEGERMVAQVLGSLQRYGWVALHDVHWPGRPKANIDHIAVGPGGVVIIDAKYWTGDIELTPTKLTQNGYSRRTQVDAVADAASAVAAILAPEHRLATSAVLALAAQDADPTPLGATTVVGREALPAYLVTLPPKLSAYDVADTARFLHQTLAGTRSPTLATTALLDVPEQRRRGRRKRATPEAALLPALPAAHESLRPSSSGRRRDPCPKVQSQRGTGRKRVAGGKPKKSQRRRNRSSGTEDFLKFLLIGAVAVWAYFNYLA